MDFDTASHNPLYVADSQEGEYGLETDNKKVWESIYAGVYDIGSSIDGFPLLFVIRF